MALGVYCQLTLVASSRMCFEVNADGRHAVSTLHAVPTGLCKALDHLSETRSAIVVSNRNFPTQDAVVPEPGELACYELACYEAVFRRASLWNRLLT